MRLEHGTFRGIAGCRSQVVLNSPQESVDFRWIDERKMVIVRQRDSGVPLVATAGQCMTLADEYAI